MARVPTAVVRARRLTQVAGARIRNELRARHVADRAAANGMVPNGGIAVFFATGPENLYQFDQWRRPLEHLAERLPAALIQAQRDFFGAHTYRRVDKEGSFHTEWTADHSESTV